MHHIGRIDHDRTNRHGWRVTIQRWNRVYIRNFSDRPHGGRDQALAAAQVYRDELPAQCAPGRPRLFCTNLREMRMCSSRRIRPARLYSYNEERPHDALAGLPHWLRTLWAWFRSFSTIWSNIWWLELCTKQWGGQRLRRPRRVSETEMFR